MRPPACRLQLFCCLRNDQISKNTKEDKKHSYPTQEDMQKGISHAAPYSWRAEGHFYEGLCTREWLQVNLWLLVTTMSITASPSSTSPPKFSSHPHVITRIFRRKNVENYLSCSCGTRRVEDSEKDKVYDEKPPPHPHDQRKIDTPEHPS